MTRWAVVALLGLALAGCGAGSADPPPPVAVPALPSAQPPLPTAPVQVGAVRLVAELARTPEQREAGLRGREVPPGTGMAFRYPEGAVVAFTMAGVDRPLVAVFAAKGRAVLVVRMPPCAGTVAQCPSYGPATPVDLVVEAAPGTLVGAAEGDPVRVG